MQVSKLKEVEVQKIMKKYDFFFHSYMHKDYFGNQIA
jgi:hypothetical protein